MYYRLMINGVFGVFSKVNYAMPIKIDHYVYQG